MVLSSPFMMNLKIKKNGIIQSFHDGSKDLKKRKKKRRKRCYYLGDEALYHIPTNVASSRGHVMYRSSFFWGFTE